MDVDGLSRAMGGTVSRERYAALLPAFTAAMREAGCTTVERAAMWCAQLGHESNGLLWMEELASGADYEGRRDLGNTEPGDGRRFKGRGPIQVTGRHNYTECSRWAHGRGLVPTPTYFVDNPAELASDRYGFVGAVWYWTAARPQLNALADARDIVAATRAINGGTNGLPDRQLRYTRCLALGAALLPEEG
ncbi:peptidase C39, partial [Rhodococcus hoagii]|nr:peptidase C39 [Prescottella equi]